LPERFPSAPLHTRPCPLVSVIFIAMFHLMHGFMSMFDDAQIPNDTKWFVRWILVRPVLVFPVIFRYFLVLAHSSAPCCV
jgi:hypothetical protein